MRALLSLLAFAGLCLAQAPKQASDFVIQKPNGEKVRLAQLRGKPLVLALLESTCSHCQNTAALLQRLHTEYAPKGLQIWTAIFAEGDASRVDTFQKQFQPSIPCGSSTLSAVARFLGAPPNEEVYVPILVFIDKRGSIQKVARGESGFFADTLQEKNIRAELESLLQPASDTSKAQRGKGRVN